MSTPRRITKDLLSQELVNELDLKISKGEPIEWDNVINKPQLADGSWKPPVESPADLPLVGNSDGDIRLTLGAEKFIFTWSANNNQWMLIGANDTSVDWGHIQNKPISYPPSTHKHVESDITDLDKYTRAEVDSKLVEKSSINHTHSYDSLTGIPTQFQPISHTHTESDIIDLDKYTKAEVDGKLSGKSNSSHTHPIANITNLQSTLDTKVDKVSGKGLSENDFTSVYKSKLEALSNSATVDYETMDAKVTAHTSDSVIHVTELDKNLWNTVSGKSDKQYVDTQLGSKANTSTLTGHTGNSTIHVTQSDKDNWNGKETPEGSQAKIDAHASNSTLHITATERSSWNAKSDFSGDYNDLTNKPEIPPDITVDSTQPSSGMWFKIL